MVSFRWLLGFGLIAPSVGPVRFPLVWCFGVPTLVRSEGVAERLGDIILNCTGPAGRTISGNLTVSLNTHHHQSAFERQDRRRANCRYG